MKVFITKYALSNGIIEAEAEMISPTMVRYNEGDAVIHVGKSHWHTDREKAVKKAEKMREREVWKLECRISILKSLRFK